MTQRLVYAALAVLTLSAPAAAQGYEPRTYAPGGYEPRGYEPRSYEPRSYEPRSYEPRGYERGAMPPYEVFTMLRSAGLDPVGAPARQGPNYVLRAFDRSDREVRVVVDARSGDILSVRPVAMASREALPPRGAVGAYERMPPGYMPPDTYRDGPRGRTNARPSIDDDDDDVDVRSAPPRDPSVIRADPDRSGMLPPPPERFPQRAAPAASPKPAQRGEPAQRSERAQPVQRSAAAPPKQAPLPKPKPSMAPSVGSETQPPAIQQPPAKWEDPPAPAAAPAKSPSTDDTPH